MTKYFLTTIPLVVSTGIFSGCGLEKQMRSSQRTFPAQYVEGSFVIETANDDAGTLKAAGQEVAGALGCQANDPEKINWSNQAGITGVSSESLEKTWNLRFEGCDFSRDGTESILEKLGASSGVVSVEAEAIAAASPINENDRFKGQQTYLTFIERDAACNLIPRQEDVKPIVVAVIDTGVDIDHPDLKDALYRDSSGQVIGANFVGSGAAMPHDDQFDDQNGHGTHVAGLVAATSGNREGIAGVAACAPVKIMPIRVLGASGSGSSVEIERGVKWAVDHGADILNLSLGYTATTYSREEVSRPVYDLAARRNVIVFAAAGNDSLVNGSSAGGGFRYGLPAAYKNVLGVAATDNSGSLTGFSNRGDRVDIATPGAKLLSTFMGGDYRSLSGTSMASPVAAGIYALALSAARTGDMAESAGGRLDFETVSGLLADSSIPGSSLNRSDVRAGGVLDAKVLVAATVERYGRSISPTQPDVVAPQPDVVAPQPQNLTFAGITEGQRLNGPLKISLTHLPSATKSIYVAWAGSIFTSMRVEQGATAVEDRDRWYLWGSGQLTAYAVDAKGRVLSKVSISLRGF